MKIAHIINPVKIGPESDLYIAQPITMHTMLQAQAFARNSVVVDLYTTQYKEDREIIPKGLNITEDLKRSILDIKTFKTNRKLPLIGDILNSLYTNSDSDIFIYTNVDIALKPFFYLTIKSLLELGYDGFCINRKTIPKSYLGINELNIANLPLLYSIEGENHPGIDCFVFQRSIYPKFQLGNICIGFPPIGAVLFDNIKNFPRILFG
ncbi:MAG: hypothetical protein ABIA75_07510 [Candidatus Neomarinimicrobiota bacterium]